MMKQRQEEVGKEMKKHIPSFSDDVILEILLRLPVRSLLRFKCVCKSWLSLISSPQFAKLHFDLAAALSHRLLVIFREAPEGSIESIDADASLRDDSASVYLPLPPTSLPRRYLPEILCSCRGLVLLYYGIVLSNVVSKHNVVSRYKDTDLIVWNPSTGFQKRITQSRQTISYFHGFGYDASTDDYLLISISLDQANRNHRTTTVEFFSFKTNSWNTMEAVNVNYKDTGILAPKTGSLLNGALHWLVISVDKRLPVIIAFDLVERSLSEIPLPCVLADDYMNPAWSHAPEHRQLHSLREMGGCLSACCVVTVCGKVEKIEIWVMREYKVFSSWTKSVVVSGGNCDNHFSPLCITKDGGILGSSIRGRLEKLNDKGELLESLSYAGNYIGNLHSGLYRESLLSLPPNSKETSEDD